MIRSKVELTQREYLPVAKLLIKSEEALDDLTESGFNIDLQIPTAILGKFEDLVGKSIERVGRTRITKMRRFYRDPSEALHQSQALISDIPQIISNELGEGERVVIDITGRREYHEGRFRRISFRMEDIPHDAKIKSVDLELPYKRGEKVRQNIFNYQGLHSDIDLINPWMLDLQERIWEYAGLQVRN